MNPLKPFDLTEHLRRLALGMLSALMFLIFAAVYSASDVYQQRLRKSLMDRIYSSTGTVVVIDADEQNMTIKAAGDMYWRYQYIAGMKLKDPVTFLVDDGGTFGDYTDDEIFGLHFAGGLYR